jgi:acid phosphatase (class A)
MRILLLSFFVSVSAFADWTKIKPTEFLIDPPPAKGSAAEKKDFQELHRLQESRTEEECELARRQAHPKYESFFEDSSFTLLTKKQIASAKPLVSRVMDHSIRISGFYKDKYRRPRPFNVDKNLKPCAEKPSGAKAYPSSHAASAYAAACVLGLAFPKQNAALEEHGLMLGNLRVVVGVHHPTDVIAGQKIGKDFCRWLERESDFQEELRQIK